mmetsp:Transcript_42847/g.118438  ORF Transcript_42847/g.118438 Transcript_42847/m.118438 type:complete len:205 (-) Transcript_42847:1581-2195(-)
MDLIKSMSALSALPPGERLIPFRASSAIECTSSTAKELNSLAFARACCSMSFVMRPMSSIACVYIGGIRNSSACVSGLLSALSSPLWSSRPAASRNSLSASAAPVEAQAALASATCEANSSAWLWPCCSRAHSLPHSRRSVSSLLRARREPARIIAWSDVSSPSTQSRRSSLKAPWNTTAICCCPLSALTTSLMAPAFFSHCLG